MPCALWPYAFCARIRRRRFAVAWRLPGRRQGHSLPAAGAAVAVAVTAEAATAEAAEAAAVDEAVVGDAALERGNSHPYPVAGVGA